MNICIATKRWSVRAIHFIAFIVFSYTSFSQSKYTLSGYVRDSLSGETLIGASLAIAGQKTA
jgi:hypothetical protein